ncbi:MAG: EAL domain-containing protein [Eubacterium sp.]|nr:EAL domain-containing protein [Eubacterium sp.]
MERQLTEDEIVESVDEAIKNGDIYAVFQPQINHATGRMVGAEALMRWKHPEFGMQYPATFIPVMEAYDLVFRADLHIFEEVCQVQRYCLDNHIPLVPLSFNMSRYDIYRHDYVEKIEEIRKKYDIPVKFLRVEITESSAIGGMEILQMAINRLHEYGYLVEMDDFGSGYSSLNILKDLDVDIIKLDMRFLSGGVGGRGGTIISSIIQMTKWLNTPVIAEGVETSDQADYMESIGCYYVQGYLYFRPIDRDEFILQLKTTDHEPLSPAMNLIRTMDAGKFWDPDSLETLIFSNFVGAAAVMTYRNGKLEILRINKKYIREIGMNMDEKELIGTDPWDSYDETNKALYEATIKKAIRTRDEETCETQRRVCSKSCGDTMIWVRTDLRVIGQAGDEFLIYAMIKNITSEKEQLMAVIDSERKFRYASDQVNIYAWEYIFATKDMRPCFRCMRDLHLPPVVKNYPEPVFENGLFPMDYKESYYELLQNLENGLESADVIIPLTVGRIPFHVRYTTEFDETGKPLKAYGSATLVVDGES